MVGGLCLAAYLLSQMVCLSPPPVKHEAVFRGEGHTCLWEEACWLAGREVDSRVDGETLLRHGVEIGSKLLDAFWTCKTLSPLLDLAVSPPAKRIHNGTFDRTLQIISPPLFHPPVQDINCTAKDSTNTPRRRQASKLHNLASSQPAAGQRGGRRKTGSIDCEVCKRAPHPHLMHTHPPTPPTHRSSSTPPHRNPQQRLDEMLHTYVCSARLSGTCRASSPPPPAVPLSRRRRCRRRRRRGER